MLFRFSVFFFFFSVFLSRYGSPQVTSKLFSRSIEIRVTLKFYRHDLKISILI